jgi:hypothetical protein
VTLQSTAPSFDLVDALEDPRCLEDIIETPGLIESVKAGDELVLVGIDRRAQCGLVRLERLDLFAETVDSMPELGLELAGACLQPGDRGLQLLLRVHQLQDPSVATDDLVLERLVAL